jgi:hypothetical protein
MSSTMNFKVYEHPLPSPLLQSALRSTLPHSITLVYRTQHANHTADTHVLATFPPSSSSSSTSKEEEEEDVEVPQCWAAAYLDRSKRPETDLWLFAPGQMPGHYTPPPPPSTSSASATTTPASAAESRRFAYTPPPDPSAPPVPATPSLEAFCPTCAQAIFSLIRHITTLPIPEIHPSNQASLDLAKHHETQHPEPGPHPSSAGAYVRHLLTPSVLTLGACDASIVGLLDAAGLVRHDFLGAEALLNKFVFKISDLPATRDLPAELYWGEVREQDIGLVQSTTSIPRAARTLLSMVSVAVFERATNLPVAWAFLGLDGSLTTLHTQPEWRGRGIAKAVAAKIFREHAPGLAVDGAGNAWAHADVYVGNRESERVCGSLGGRAGMQIYWVRIDVDGGKVGALAG